MNRVNSFMRAYSDVITSLPVVINNQYTDFGKSVVYIARYFKDEMELKSGVDYNFTPNSKVFASTLAAFNIILLSYDEGTGKLNSMLGYKGNLKSLLYHEYNHLWGEENIANYRPYGGWGKGGDYHVLHLQEYKSQLEHSSWSETTDSYREHVRNNVNKYLKAPGDETDRKSFKKYFEGKFKNKGNSSGRSGQAIYGR